MLVYLNTKGCITPSFDSSNQIPQSFRPATLFGVDGKALAELAWRRNQSFAGEMRRAGIGPLALRLSGGNVGGVEYALTTHQYGCWSATRVGLPANDTPVERSVSGCIGLADMFGS